MRILALCVVLLAIPYAGPAHASLSCSLLSFNLWACEESFDQANWYTWQATPMIGVFTEPTSRRYQRGFRCNDIPNSYEPGVGIIQEVHSTQISVTFPVVPNFQPRTNYTPVQCKSPGEQQLATGSLSGFYNWLLFRNTSLLIYYSLD